MSERTYWISVNQYRSSTDAGFANTWSTYRVGSRAEQVKLLTEGLPVSDTWWRDREGRDHAIRSTMGIATATRYEIREARRQLQWDESAVPYIAA